MSLNALWKELYMCEEGCDLTCGKEECNWQALWTPDLILVDHQAVTRAFEFADFCNVCETTGTSTLLSKNYAMCSAILDEMESSTRPLNIVDTRYQAMSKDTSYMEFQNMYYSIL
jgi:hypothetical protein